MFLWLAMMKEVVFNVTTTLLYSILRGDGGVSGVGSGQLFDPTTDEVLIFLSRNIVLVAWSIQILFCILVRHATILFTGLNQHMEVILKGDDSSVALIAIKLETWRQNHVLICQLVDAINDCFGLVLLLSIGCYFISLIILSYELYYDVFQYLSGCQVGYHPWINVLLASRHLFHFVLIVMMPYQMQNQVTIDRILKHSNFKLVTTSSDVKSN